MFKFFSDKSICLKFISLFFLKYFLTKENMNVLNVPSIIIFVFFLLFNASKKNNKFIPIIPETPVIKILLFLK